MGRCATAVWYLLLVSITETMDDPASCRESRLGGVEEAAKHHLAAG